MSKPIFIDWCPKDVLDGVQMLEPMEELAYRRILDLIYVTGDNLPDDGKRMAWMTKTGRKWPAIRQALIDMGKIEVSGGRITNPRCRETLQKVAQKIEQKVGAGKASADVRKSLKSNKTAPTGVGASVITGVPTTQEPKNPIEIQRDITTTESVAREAVAATEPASVIVAHFLKLRRELWPNECGFPAPTLTLATEARGYLEMGGTVPLICETIERGMRTAASQDKAATVSLKAFRLSIHDAIASHRAGQEKPHGNRNHPRSVGPSYADEIRANRIATINALSDELGAMRPGAGGSEPGHPGDGIPASEG